MVPVHRLKSKVEQRFSQIRRENKAHHDNKQKLRWPVEKTYSYACRTISAKLKLSHLIILKHKNHQFPKRWDKDASTIQSRTTGHVYCTLPPSDIGDRDISHLCHNALCIRLDHSSTEPHKHIYKRIKGANRDKCKSHGAYPFSCI